MCQIGRLEQAEAAIERGNENYLHAHEAHFGLLQEETGTEGGLLTDYFWFMLRISWQWPKWPESWQKN